MDLTKELFQEVLSAAEQEYPKECCGLILKSSEVPETFRHIRVKNVQDDLHALDPESFPRTARSAYAMDGKELLLIHKDLRERKEAIAVIYHSHPDQDAFFSKEDQRLALDDLGEPVYARAHYLVVSVRLGKAVAWKFFHWDRQNKEFIE